MKHILLSVVVALVVLGCSDSVRDSKVSAQETDSLMLLRAATFESIDELKDAIDRQIESLGFPTGQVVPFEEREPGVLRLLEEARRGLDTVKTLFEPSGSYKWDIYLYLSLPNVRNAPDAEKREQVLNMKASFLCLREELNKNGFIRALGADSLPVTKAHYYTFFNNYQSCFDMYDRRADKVADSLLD